MTEPVYMHSQCPVKRFYGDTHLFDASWNPFGVTEDGTVKCTRCGQRLWGVYVISEDPI